MQKLQSKHYGSYLATSKHKFPYKWKLSDGYPAQGIENHGLKVFGTFICGGGSTMGYKLAGFEHLGGVEIDKKVADVYKENHKPKHLYVEDLRDFNKRNDLPKELYELDLLDGSPPCSTFSTAGIREKAWGKKKMFAEGQSLQTLDDLVFVYCDTIIKLKPKVFILENVTGVIKGNAKSYAKNIVKKMTDAGYTVKVFQLNAASMGVPQKRERVFFIGHRKELKFNPLKLEFNEPQIKFNEVDDNKSIYREKIKSEYALKLLKNVTLTGHLQTNIKSIGGKMGSVGFGFMVLPGQTPLTLTTNAVYYYDRKSYITNVELLKIGTYPLDYNFNAVQPKYLIGMSVPPVMTAQIAHQIYLQWFKNSRKTA